jgi:outer membrane lipoprotein-sorting protein
MRITESRKWERACPYRGGLLPTVTRAQFFPLAILLAIALFPNTTRAEEAPKSDPWEILEKLRAHLSAAPIELDFVQTFVPFGFTSGDQESGTMALMLPDCVRWDYLEPFPKVFLLCDETAYAWNPGEKTGRRYQVAAQDQASLDLIRLSSDNLKERYSATTEITAKNERVIALIPKIQDGQITTAKIVIASAGDRIIQLEFSDTDGNLTNFEMTNHRALIGQGTFTAPGQLTWLEN